MKLRKGSKVKFALKYSPYLTGLGTIKEIYSGVDVQCVYLVEIQEIQEIQGYYFYKAGDTIFVFPQEIEKKVYF